MFWKMIHYCQEMGSSQKCHSLFAHLFDDTTQSDLDSCNTGLERKVTTDVKSLINTVKGYPKAMTRFHISSNFSFQTSITAIQIRLCCVIKEMCK